MEGIGKERSAQHIAIHFVYNASNWEYQELSKVKKFVLV